MKQPAEVETIAEEHLVAGRPEEAARICELHVDDNPPSIIILRILTAACERLGRMERAYEIALKWALLAPFDPYAHYKLGMLEQARGRFGEAVSRYALVCDLAGDETDVGRAAQDSIQALDILQLQQISALAEVDVVFRKRLRQDVRQAINERGFVLSPRGLMTIAQAADEIDETHGKPLGGTYYQ